MYCLTAGIFAITPNGIIVSIDFVLQIYSKSIKLLPTTKTYVSVQIIDFGLPDHHVDHDKKDVKENVKC